MFLRFRAWLHKFDDETFLSDISTPEGRQEKIETFRRRRSFLFAGIILTLGWVFLFSVPWLDIFLVAVFFIGFVVVDSQIKTLLLYDKTQTK